MVGIKKWQCEIEKAVMKKRIWRYKELIKKKSGKKKIEEEGRRKRKHIHTRGKSIV
jgi:hypothetical protein